MAILNDCLLAERSLSPAGCGGGEVVAVAPDDPLDREPPDRLRELEGFAGISTPLSLAPELPPPPAGTLPPPVLIGTETAVHTRECSDPLLLPPTKNLANVNNDPIYRTITMSQIMDNSYISRGRVPTIF